MSDQSSVEIIKEQIYTICNYSTHRNFTNYLRSLTIKNHFQMFKTDKNGPSIPHIYDNDYVIGSNLYVVIFPDKGIVIIMTKNDAEKLSGINLWVTGNSDVTKPLRINLYHDMNLLISPKIIVTDLPTESIIHSRIENNSNNNSQQDNLVINTCLESLLESSNY